MLRLTIWIKTKLHGQLVGSDELGNSYYRSKHSERFFGKEGRWVLYKGVAEASKISSYWFSWLHYQTDEVASAITCKSWEKSRNPNMTGEPGAYYPPGSPLALNKRDNTVGDYERWQPLSMKSFKEEIL